MLEERTAKELFFTAYFGPKPKATGYRMRASQAHWCRVRDAFLNPEHGAHAIEAARQSYERLTRRGDPQAGSTYAAIEAAEAAEAKAKELREIYATVAATRDLPEFWRAYSHRPGAKQAGRRFEAMLTAKPQPTAEQGSLFLN